jgi:hypothetical protein
VLVAILYSYAAPPPAGPTLAIHIGSPEALYPNANCPVIPPIYATVDAMRIGGDDGSHFARRVVSIVQRAKDPLIAIRRRDERATCRPATLAPMKKCRVRRPCLYSTMLLILLWLLYGNLKLLFSTQSGVVCPTHPHAKHGRLLSVAHRTAGRAQNRQLEHSTEWSIPVSSCSISAM